MNKTHLAIRKEIWQVMSTGLVKTRGLQHTDQNIRGVIHQSTDRTKLKDMKFMKRLIYPALMYSEVHSGNIVAETHGCQSRLSLKGAWIIRKGNLQCIKVTTENQQGY
jgi:hypothetical protein